MRFSDLLSAPPRSALSSRGVAPCVVHSKLPPQGRDRLNSCDSGCDRLQVHMGASDPPVGRLECINILVDNLT
jgi:hypothetical protein